MSEFAFEIIGAPDYAYAEVIIPEGKTLKVEASAMATMDTNIEMKTKFKGGLSRLLTGESIFINEFTSKAGSGKIGIAPSAPGDFIHLEVKPGEEYFLQNSAFVASGMGINIESKFQGLTKTFFSGEGLFLIKCSGEGDLFLNSYGGIIAIDVEDGYIVDTGNIVAFTGGLSYEIKSIGGYKSLFLSGEGLVAKFSGKGTVWIQTKKVRPLISWANPFRPQKG
ncbi:MAG: TIGR00266 family protein [Saprospiraceae bacterium]|nr:TIGR00266 family protein [Saprospiraceae bacterium]